MCLSFYCLVQSMDSGASGDSTAPAVRHVVEALNTENGPALILLQLMVARRVKVSNSKRSKAFLQHINWTNIRAVQYFD